MPEETPLTAENIKQVVQEHQERTGYSGPPTESANWRSARKEGFVVELPSGNHCRVRRTLDMLDMVRSGKVPNRLITIVQQMMGTRNLKELNLTPDELDPEILQQMTEFVDVCATRVMIQPRCMAPPPDEPEPQLWEPPEGAISTYDLSQEDKLFLFHVAQGGVADVEKFRTEQASSLAALSDVPEVQSAPKQPAVAG